MQAPTPGTYRTRVVNSASTQVDYHGSIAVTSFGREKRGGKPASGRATQDRPDLAQAPQLHVILGASAGCGARDFGAPDTGAGMSEAIALQELVHKEGVVRPQAPHHCWAFRGHTYTAAAGAAVGTTDPESVDVMFPAVPRSVRRSR